MNLKPNFCISEDDGILHRCTAERHSECRFFIHDVAFWSHCGHFAQKQCLCGAAQRGTRIADLKAPDVDPVAILGRMSR
jgi:hypothetical protein